MCVYCLVSSFILALIHNHMHSHILFFLKQHSHNKQRNDSAFMSQRTTKNVNTSKNSILQKLYSTLIICFWFYFSVATIPRSNHIKDRTKRTSSFACLNCAAFIATLSCLRYSINSVACCHSRERGNSV